jgi:PKD repeat protein
MGPDGKIYVVSGVSDTVMHVINTPNQPGYASHFTQHSINLPNLNDKSIPNFPNYRLGPLDGSPCDTLGLNNHPLAGFTYFPEELTVTFSDNSYYRPEEWAWDFGDGQNSTERNPIYSYDMAGEYYVCLTVRNEIDEDTYCRWVQVDTMMVVGVGEVSEMEKVAVFPNPACNFFNLQYDLPNASTISFSLHNVTGRQVREWNVPSGKQCFSRSIHDVPEGLYFWVLSVEGKQLVSGKLMVN